MTLSEFLLALAFRSMSNNDIHNMLEREVLVRQSGQYKVTQHWSDVIDEILSDSSGATDKSDEELLELAKQMRGLYPQGKMKNRYGQPTPYYYRCNNGEVVKKLKKFFAVYGNVSEEDILDATRRYVASFQGNYANMRLIKYFIMKDDVKPSEDGTGHVEQISDLATFLENKESEGEGVNNDDWTTKVI